MAKHDINKESYKNIEVSKNWIPFNESNGDEDQQVCQNNCPAEGGRLDLEGDPFDVFIDNSGSLMQGMYKCYHCPYLERFCEKIKNA